MIGRNGKKEEKRGEVEGGPKEGEKRSPIQKNGEKITKKTPEIMSFIYFNLRPFRFAHQPAHHTRLLARMRL